MNQFKNNGINMAINPESVKIIRDNIAAESMLKAASSIDSKIEDEDVAEDQLQALEQIANKLWQEAGESTKERERVASLLSTAKVQEDGTISVGSYLIGKDGEINRKTGSIKNLSTGAVTPRFKPVDFSGFASEASPKNFFNFSSPSTDSPPFSPQGERLLYSVISLREYDEDGNLVPAGDETGDEDKLLPTWDYLRAIDPEPDDE